jgi:arylsulfatase A-like enzyme
MFGRSVVAVCLVAGLLALPSGIGGCRKQQQPGTTSPQRPNVVLVSIDTLRADHVGCLGYERDTTPSLDRLAGEGVLFSQAFAPASWTLPSHMSLMTSRYPHRHGVERETLGLPSSVPLLAEVLQGEGYRTAGFISWFYVAGRYGFARGFDEYVDLLPERHELADAVSGDQVVDRALAWLDDVEPSSDKPFFLFVHLFDPHIDYSPPPPYDTMYDPDYEGPMDGKYMSLHPYIRGIHGDIPTIDPRDLQHVVALYDGEVRFADDQLERLVSALRERDDLEQTLLVVLSDHGEELADHGSMEGHQWTLYDEVLHVPLVIRPPGGTNGRKVDALVDLLDVAPTVLDLLDIAPPPTFEGTSLVPWLEGQGAGNEHRLVFGKIERFHSKLAVRSKTHKLIGTRIPGPEPGDSPWIWWQLFDLTADPEEKNDLYRADHPAVETLHPILVEWVTTGAPADVPVLGSPFTDEERARLEALGYVEETTPTGK